MFCRAVDAGINFMGACDYYSAGASEEIVVALIADGNRGAFVLATKVGNPMGRDAHARGYSREHFIEAAEHSQRRLRTDYIDLYQTHIWESSRQPRGDGRVVRPARARRQSALRRLSDMPFWQFATAYFHAERRGLARFAAVQNHDSLLWREDERSFCDSVGCRASVSLRAALWRAASCTIAPAARMAGMGP